MMSLRHLPTSLIMSISTLVISSTMVTPSCMERALMYSCLKPTCEPEISTASLSALIILVLQMYDQLFLLYTAASGVCPAAPCCQRCATWCLIDFTAHALGFPVSTCPIDSPFDSFFYWRR